MEFLHIYPTVLLVDHKTTSVVDIVEHDNPKPLRIVDIMELIEKDDPDKDSYIVSNNIKLYY